MVDVRARVKTTQADLREFLAHGLGVDANQPVFHFRATGAASAGKVNRLGVASFGHLDQQGSRVDLPIGRHEGQRTIQMQRCAAGAGLRIRRDRTSCDFAAVCIDSAQGPRHRIARDIHLEQL